MLLRNYASSMMQRIFRVGLVLLLISALAFLTGWLWGPPASGAVVVIAGTVLGMFYLPSWGIGQVAEQDHVRERLVQNMKAASAEEHDNSDQ